MIYDIFYNYYSNIQNQDILRHPLNYSLPQYYYYDKKTSKNLQSKILPNQYFIYNNIQIYIQFINNNELLFIIPRNTLYGLVGDHFHIGPIKISQKNINRSKINRSIVINKNPIFLHWSLQDIIKQERNMFSKCTIQDNFESLNQIDQILCTNRSHKLKDEFNAKYNSALNSSVNPIVQGLSPNDLNLLVIIKHILRRPFYPLQIAGRTINTINKNKIYNGPAITYDKVLKYMNMVKRVYFDSDYFLQALNPSTFKSNEISGLLEFAYNQDSKYSQSPDNYKIVYDKNHTDDILEMYFPTRYRAKWNKNPNNLIHDAWTLSMMIVLNKHGKWTEFKENGSTNKVICLNAENFDELRMKQKELVKINYSDGEYCIVQARRINQFVRYCDLSLKEQVKDGVPVEIFRNQEKLGNALIALFKKVEMNRRYNKKVSNKKN
jgi:hypothetical protein